MYTFLLSEFIKLSKFELERELPQTDQSEVFFLVFRLWYKQCCKIRGINPTMELFAHAWLRHRPHDRCWYTRI